MFSAAPDILSPLLSHFRRTDEYSFVPVFQHFIRPSPSPLHSLLPQHHHSSSYPPRSLLGCSSIPASSPPSPYSWFLLIAPSLPGHSLVHRPLPPVHSLPPQHHHSLEQLGSFSPVTPWSRGRGCSYTRRGLDTGCPAGRPSRSHASSQLVHRTCNTRK